MAKPRSKTIQERFGFSDKDLKTPLHDEIMLWLDNAIRNYVELLLPFLQDWKLKDFYVKEGKDEITGYEKEYYFNELNLPEKPKVKPENMIWEYQITTGSSNKYVVGFADLMVSYKHYSLDYEIKEKKFSLWCGETEKLFFEVKTTIPTLGELIRQIRLYQTYVSGQWFVITPDMKYEEQLKSQGICSIKYEPNRFENDEAVGPDGLIYKIPIE